jgi:hypothetical protein
MLASKRQLSGDHGFAPVYMPDWLYPFQAHLVEWSCRRGRAAVFADCGLGKTPMQLVWAENVARKTGGRVLILTPLAVAAQTAREAEKFGVEAVVARNGEVARITVTNYAQLHKFNPSDFCGCVLDESSILKSFDGSTRAAITEFMRRMPYRLLCTATAAPNDYTELGTSSEALGDLGFVDMLSRFFKKTEKSYTRRDQYAGASYRFRGHAETAFWRWVCSWARACRKPSDLGFADGPFRLPPLNVSTQVVSAATPRDGMLFDLPAVGIREQRDERRRTIEQRCQCVAYVVRDARPRPVVVWCHLNAEGDMLERMIPDAKQVSGSDDDDRKEDALRAFADGGIRVLVTKPTIAGWGLNWQHCADQTYFPSHSYEQWYQAVRRSWRFGQSETVRVTVVASEGDADVIENMRTKQEAADRMFASLVDLMGDALTVTAPEYGGEKVEVPSWL